MLTYVLFIIGFFVLIYGAEWLVDGSSILAKKLGVSSLIIGLTVVAFGTSLPELIVNLFASSEEAGSLAVGNILGSNIANTLLVLGVAAFVVPLTIHRMMVWREILFNMVAAGMLGVLVADRFLVGNGAFEGLSRIDGAVLISYFFIFLYYTFGRSTYTPVNVSKAEQKQLAQVKIPITAFKILGGSLGLFFGGKWIVEGAIEIAGDLGVSDAFIGLTVVAIGTSLPELAASLVAVKKKSVDIAVGNIVGSNMFNIFWVLGLGSFLRPLEFPAEQMADVGMVIAVSAILFWFMAVGRHKHQLSKQEGMIFVGLYASYLSLVVMRGFEFI